MTVRDHSERFAWLGPLVVFLGALYLCYLCYFFWAAYVLFPCTSEVTVQRVQTDLLGRPIKTTLRYCTEIKGLGVKVP